MPEGSKVEKVYTALRDQGMDKGKAARIAQAQTGQALATGKPPKGSENMVSCENGSDMDKQVEMHRQTAALMKSGKVDEAYAMFLKTPGANPLSKEEFVKRFRSYQNGVARAQQELANKYPTFCNALIVLDKDGKRLYWDGFGWSLLKTNAKQFDAASAVATRSNIHREFPQAQIVMNGLTI